MKKLRTTIIAAAAVAVLTGCSGEYKEERGRGDAPVGSSDDSPANIVNMPNKFSNVAYKCTPEGDMVYSASIPDGGTSGAITVVEGHPDCQK